MSYCNLATVVILSYLHPPSKFKIYNMTYISDDFFSCCFILGVGNNGVLLQNKK